MCNNFPNIKVVEGNAFSVLVPLKVRTFESCRPIDEDIDPTKLSNVVFKFGGVSYTPIVDERGVAAVLPATLSRGTYDIVVTADYEDNPIRAAYEGAITIVPWNSQSDAQQYLPGSPIVLEAAYIIGGALTDAELEALKEEYREKNAQLDQAIADAEAAKEHYDELAEQLQGVAQEQTLTDGVTAIREDISHIDIDTSDLAKQGTNPSATLSEVQAKIGVPASGQGADLFAAMRDIALSATTLQELADSWSAMVTNRSSLDGVEFASGFEVNGQCDLINNIRYVRVIRDNTSLSASSAQNAFFSHSQYLQEYYLMRATAFSFGQAFRNCGSLKIVEMRSVTSFSSDYAFNNCYALNTLRLPSVKSFSGSNMFTNDSGLIDITLGAIASSFNSLSTWSPTTALNASSQTLLTPEDIAAGFTSNLEKLLYNIREHIAANLPVANNTITFSAAVKAAINADTATAAAFTNKGWTIA